jgi:hypothetical protein
MIMEQKKIFSSKLFFSILAFFTVFVLMACNVHAEQSSVDLGTAGDFVILAKSGISTTGVTLIKGDIGVSPIDSTAITGFGLIMDSSNRFSTSSLLTGKIYAADYALPTPSRMTTAITDMETAYTDAAGRALPDYTGLGAGNIDGMTLTPGLYKWGTGVVVPTEVTLSGGANDVWIFQIAQDLTVGNGAVIKLSGGAQAKNIFWQVAGQTVLGTTSVFNGNILCKTSIVMNTGATLNGKALAQTAVTLDSNNISTPIVSSTPSTLVSGTITDQNSDAIDAALVKITCNHLGTEAIMTVSSDANGKYHARYKISACDIGDAVKVNAKKDSVEGDNQGIVDTSRKSEINVSIVNVQIPEFGLIAGSLLSVGILSVLIYRKNN